MGYKKLNTQQTLIGLLGTKNQLNKTVMNYTYNDLSDLCDNYLQVGAQDIDNKIVYSNEKMYCLCANFINDFRSVNNKGINALLDFFNKK